MSKKNFHLPLLAGLSALLSACQDTPSSTSDTTGLVREQYRTLSACQQAYQVQVRQGLQNPCTGTGGSFYGPYHSSVKSTSKTVQYIGYSKSGALSEQTLMVNPKTGRATSYSSPRTVTSRGGFVSSRSGSFGSHSSGGE